MHTISARVTGYFADSARMIGSVEGLRICFGRGERSIDAGSRTRWNIIVDFGTGSGLSFITYYLCSAASV